MEQRKPIIYIQTHNIMNSKKVFFPLLFSFILIGIGTSNAQDAIQIDYFKALSLNSEELKLYMSKIGFDIESASKDDNGYDFAWIYKRETIAPAKGECHFHIYFQKDRSKLLSFQTDIYEDYLRFKKALQLNGLKPTREKNYNDFLIEFYSNSLYESTIYSKPENHIIHYEISLKKTMFLN